MSAKYTPGPWDWVNCENAEVPHCKVINGDGITLAETYGEGMAERAILLSEAPAMLEALRTALHCLETPGDFTEDERRNVIEDCAAILARIEGSQ